MKDEKRERKKKEEDISRRSRAFEDLLPSVVNHFGIIIPKRRFHEEKWVAYRSRPRFDPHLSRSVQESVSGVSRTSSGGLSRSSRDESSVNATRERENVFEDWSKSRILPFFPKESKRLVKQRCLAPVVSHRKGPPFGHRGSRMVLPRCPCLPRLGPSIPAEIPSLRPKKFQPSPKLP